MEIYPNLYSVAENQHCNVADAGRWNINRWSWALNWSKELSTYELNDVQLLENTLLPICLMKDSEDYWVWVPENSPIYSVKSAYQLLMWGTVVPSKFSVFAWRLLMDGLPTRFNSQQRGVLTQCVGCSCVFCFREDEDLEHLFFKCSLSVRFWRLVDEWASISQGNFSGRWENFLQHLISIQHKKRKKIRHMIWIAVVWVLWTTRNTIIFRGGVPNVNVMVNQLKHLTWGWFAHRVDTKSTITLDCWCSNSHNSLSFGGKV